MISCWIAWSIAQATPVFTTLDNGVRVVVSDTADGTSRIEAAWLSPHGTAHTAPSASAVALMATHQGTHSNPADAWLDSWVSTTGTLPEPHLCSSDAGELSALSTEDLVAWAWLTSDALADPVVTDLAQARDDAAHALPDALFDGVDRAPSPWSWPASRQALTVPDDVVVGQLDRLRDPRTLVIAVRGDIRASDALVVIDPAFARLIPTAQAAPTPEASPRVGQLRHHLIAGDTGQIIVRADTARSDASVALADWLDQGVATALNDVAADAQVRLLRDGPIWTLELRATPAVARARDVEVAWHQWLRELAGSDTPPPQLPQRTEHTVDLLHGLLSPPIDTSTSLSDELTALLSAKTTVLTRDPIPPQPALAAIAQTHGVLAAELVRLRLRTVDETPNNELESLLTTLRAERRHMPPALRPALDVVIERANSRLP